MTAEPETPSLVATRAKIAELRAQGPHHAELADVLEAILDESEDRQRGVLPIGGGYARFRKRLAELRRKGLAILMHAGNDNS